MSLSKGPSDPSAPPTTRPDPASFHPNPGRLARAPDFHPAIPRCPACMPVLTRHPLTPSPLVSSEQKPHYAQAYTHPKAPAPARCGAQMHLAHPSRFETRRGSAPCPSSQLIGPVTASLSRRGSHWLFALAAVCLAFRFAGSSPFILRTPAGWVRRASAPLCRQVPPRPRAPPPGRLARGSRPLLQPPRVPAGLTGRGGGGPRAPGLLSLSAWRLQWFCHKEFSRRFCFKLPFALCFPETKRCPSVFPILAIHILPLKPALERTDGRAPPLCLQLSTPVH